MSPGAAAVTVVASVLAAFVTVLVRRIRRSDGPSGVALGPALVAGWIVAIDVQKATPCSHIFYDCSAQSRVVGFCSQLAGSNRLAAALLPWFA